jgi:hypothetical protein
MSSLWKRGGEPTGGIAMCDEDLIRRDDTSDAVTLVLDVPIENMKSQSQELWLKWNVFVTDAGALQAGEVILGHGVDALGSVECADRTAEEGDGCGTRAVPAIGRRRPSPEGGVASTCVGLWGAGGVHRGWWGQRSLCPGRVDGREG